MPKNWMDLVRPFIIVGIGLWLLAGSMIVMTCFLPVYSVANGDSKEMIGLAMNEWGGLFTKIVPIWGLLGGVFGLVNAMVFFSRPSYEHGDVSPMINRMNIGLPQAGPKTMAEISTGMIVWPIGGLLSVAATVLMLPYFQTDLVLMKSIGVRALMGVVIGFSCIVPVLPFSLGWLRMKYGRR